METSYREFKKNNNASILEFHFKGPWDQCWRGRTFPRMENEGVKFIFSKFHRLTYVDQGHVQ
jgi:hypothetical protein